MHYNNTTQYRVIALLKKAIFISIEKITKKALYLCRKKDFFCCYTKLTKNMNHVGREIIIIIFQKIIYLFAKKNTFLNLHKKLTKKASFLRFWQKVKKDQ